MWFWKICLWGIPTEEIWYCESWYIAYKIQPLWKKRTCKQLVLFILSNRMQFTNINKSQSGKRELKYGVPQESILGPLLFILFINDLHKYIEFSTVHHFSVDTMMFFVETSLKKVNKHIKRNLKIVLEWIRAIKLFLNTSKTELVIFKSRNKTITKHLNFRISGQKFNQYLESNT